MKSVRDMWDGPIVIKGLLHPDDADKALAIGVDGIGVSNHGGRQFDGAPSAIDALVTIAERVNGRAPIIFDSGIRTGLDVMRTLALGADFVMLGRAFLFGISAFGDNGAAHVAEILLADMKANMASAGVQNVAQIQALEAVRESY